MKNITILLVSLLLMSGCGQAETTQSSNLEYIECLIDGEDNSGAYSQEYILMSYDPDDDDVVLTLEILENWHYTYEIDQSVIQEQGAELSDYFSDLKGVTYDVHTDKYLLQQKLLYDYRETDFQQLVDEEQIERTMTGHIPEYVSVELAQQDYLAQGFRCNTVDDESNSLKSELIYAELNSDGSQMIEDLPIEYAADMTDPYNNPDIKREDAILISCIYNDPNNPDLENRTTIEGHVDYDLVYDIISHEEFALTPEADRNQLNENARQEKAAYDAIEGLELDYEILDDRYSVDRHFRYSEVDLVELTESGFFGEGVLQAPTYISLQVTLDQFARDGYSCDF